MLPLENNGRSSLPHVVYADFRLVHHSACKRILFAKRRKDSRVTFKLRGQEDVAKPKKTPLNQERKLG
jgi:hypothetical protein